MSEFTQLSATAGLPGRRYGSFAKGGAAHDPGPLTHLSPTAGLPGGRYGTFGGKLSSEQNQLTELSAHGGVPGGVRGPFGGKEPSVVVEPPPAARDDDAGPTTGRPQWLRIQYARLHPLRERDRYGTLYATRLPQLARLHAIREAEVHGKARAHASNFARLHSVDDDKNTGALAAKRGAINQDVLRLFALIQRN